MPSLKKILSNHFLKYSLMPLLIIEVALLALYFSINIYITNHTTQRLQDDALNYATEVMNNESDTISQHLNEITRLTRIMQQDHQRILTSPDLYNIASLPEFSIAPNGVFYKTGGNGASLYYSSRTSIGEEQKAKAVTTEAMDPLLMALVNTNENVVAAYFNSHDNMNRLYPFIENVHEQYGEHIHMEDYNFYYLADATHNPLRKPVWTEPYLDPAGNGWMLSCVAPIYTGDFLQGVSGLDVTIEKLLDNILGLQLPYNARMFMIDVKGMLIAIPPEIEALLDLRELKEHTYTDPITQTVTKPDNFNIFSNKSEFAGHLRAMYHEQKTTSEITLEGAGDYILMSQSVRETGWQLMIMIDKEQVFASVNELKKLSTSIGYTAIGFMALFYLVFFTFLVKQSSVVSAAITRPIEMLTRQTSLLGIKGKEVEVIDTEIDELHRLSANFSQMAKELETRTKKLVDMELEKKVKEQEALMYRDKSMRDPLTGLYNRHKVDQWLANLMEEFNIHQMKFSVIFLDIDNFKQINDSFGHSSGDDVLIELAILLKTNIRQRDVACRLGGEEFVVFCATHLDAAEKVAEKLRSAIGNHIFPIERTVTASFGVAEVMANDTEDTLMLRADKALYRAKSLGRNRVEVA